MLKILELSELQKKTGRRNVKIILHEVHQSESQWNKNGITWLEPYVSQNIKSAEGQPFVAEFFDSDQDYPWGHGKQMVVNGELQFERSTVVGMIEKAYVQSLDVNGKTILAAVAEGYLFANRYPHFMSWMETKIQEGAPVESSVEIARTGDNQAIVYRDGWKQEGRIPTEFEYIGHAILGIEPADDSAVLLELNNKKKGDFTAMDLKELQKLAEDRLVEMNALKAKLEEMKAAKESVDAELATKVGEVNTLVEEVKTLGEAKATLETEKETVATELNSYKEKEAQEKLEALKAEFNSKLDVFEESEKTVAEAEINAFNEAPSTELMSKALNKINSGIVASIVEARKVETNSKKDNKAPDIFESFSGTTEETETEDVDIYS